MRIFEDVANAAMSAAPTPATLETVFLAHAPSEWARRWSGDEVRDALRHAWAKLVDASETTPDPALLGRALASALDPDSANIEALHVVDLYTAAACLDGRRDALAEFQRRFAPMVEKIGQRLAAGGISAEEFRQQAFERLLVGAPGRPPRLRSYRGTGPLPGWIRVVASRLAIDLHRHVDRRIEHPVDTPGDVAEAEVIAGVAPEVAIILRQHGARVRDLLTQRIASLSAADRRLLRLHAIEGKPFEEIARILGIHRTSASRRWAAVRDRLAAGLRDELALELQATDSAVGDLTDALRSHVEVSMARLLASGDGPPDG